MEMALAGSGEGNGGKTEMAEGSRSFGSLVLFFGKEMAGGGWLREDKRLGFLEFLWVSSIFYLKLPYYFFFFCVLWETLFISKILFGS